ncbi:MAG: diacylglycerol/lipid kinase family protein [Chthoniobacterales bacterium]
MRRLDSLNGYASSSDDSETKQTSSSQQNASKSATLAVLENPLSGLNSRQPEALKQFCQDSGISHRTASTPEALQQQVREILKNPPNILVISGGDGTISAILNVLESHSESASLPALALLHGGSTNMIQHEIGLKGNPVKALKNLLKETQNGISNNRIQWRSPFGVLDENDQSEQFGFFFAAGALSRVLHFCQETLTKKSINGTAIEALALLTVFLRLFVQKKASGDIFHHDEIRWAQYKNGADNSSDASPSTLDWYVGSHMFIYLTSLNRLLLGFDPKGRRDALKLVGYKYPFTRRGIFSYLVSRGRRGLKQESYNDSADEYLLDFKGRWVLDGEFYGQPDAVSKLKIRTCKPLPFFVM